jgi:putative nucleotidyltransferase with HDIG domain
MRREYRSVLRTTYNLSVASLSLWIASTAFYWLTDGIPSPGKLVLTDLLGPLFVLAATYFLVNSWMIAIVLAFEQRRPIVALWWKHFPWFSLNYFGGVSAAALLVSYTRTVDLGAVSIILPLLVISYLTYRTSLGRLQDAQQHVDQLNELYISTVETLAMAVDAKDQITHGHIRRVQIYATELAKRLGVDSEHQIRAVEAAALLHDMGKLAIPEHILNKPGKLTAAEFDKMKQHANIGADLLSSIKFPYPVVPIVRHHHENWDGRGYPAGIAGTDIPIGARILSVVDCFDALTSDRPYRPRLSAEDAFDILRERRGTMYDPLVVDTFIAEYPRIAPMALRAGEEAKSLIGEGSLRVSAERLAFHQIRANISENGLLTDCIQTVTHAATLYDVVEAMTQTLRQLTPARVCVVYRYDSGSDVLVCEAAGGDTRNLLSGLTIRIGERISGWCAANRRASVNSDASLDLFQLASAFPEPLRSALAVPLIHGSQLCGVFTCYSSDIDAFTDAHRYSVERLSYLVAERLGTPNQSRGIIPFRNSRPS